jgi:O-methyltransferase
VSMKVVHKLKQNRTLRRVSAYLFRRLPVRRWPTTFARFHGLNVPRLGKQPPGSRIRPPTSSTIIFSFLDQIRHVEGAVVECGVYRGSTLVTMGLYLKQKGIAKKVFGFDSFEGFGEEVQTDLGLGGDSSPVKKVGGFGDTSYQHVLDNITRFGLASAVTLVPGFFKDSLSRLSSFPSVSFLHLDCDLYDSYRECLTFFYPRLSSGAVVLFDEYCDPKWPGAKKAVDEFLQGKPETITLAEVDGYCKAYFAKA